MSRPLFVLMVGALLAGFIGLPLDSVFAGHGEEEHQVSALIHGIMIAVPLTGIGIAYLFYYSKTFSVDKLMASPLAKNLHKFWFSGWGMDALYNWLFVYPFLWLARINKDDLVDKLYALLVELSRAAHAMIVKTQTGYLRWYALSVATGLVVILTLGVLL